jgi:hypothetical protein
MLRALLAALFLCVASPAFAQMEMMFQGPWNVNAVTPRSASAERYAPGRSHSMPPRNARCGWYMGRLTGHSDRSLWLAQNWAKRFPRTSARPGAVVVYSRGGNKGHVSKIVSMRGKCRAVVHDNAGTYERDICHRVIAYVQP